MDSSSTTNWLPDLVYTGGRFENDVAISCAADGRIDQVSENIEHSIRLNNRAILPGLINSHSHAFQRVIRGRTEHRTSHSRDSFWTWREAMYSAANRLTPEDLYDASRMAFLEMVLSGITTVGEFHYLHRRPNGQAYDDPNVLAKEVVRAARDVGLRIALLRVAYARSGFQREANPQQLRFIESAETYLEHTVQLQAYLEGMSNYAWLGVAPHSVRAIPLEYLQEVVHFANKQNLPVHMHVAEQPAEVAACVAEHGRSPVALLENEGLLGERFTAVHAIHLTLDEVSLLARAKASVCACPTTERNLGDGIIPAEGYFSHGVPVCLGSDSHTQIDLLEDARELEYHLRLQKLERSVLAPTGGSMSALAARLFDCATVSGARSLESNGGRIAQGSHADFFTIDLSDPSIAGSTAEDLLSSVVFSLSRSAVKEVVVGGKMIVQDSSHPDQDEIVERFKALQKRLWT